MLFLYILKILFMKIYTFISQWKTRESFLLWIKVLDHTNKVKHKKKVPEINWPDDVHEIHIEFDEASMMKITCINIHVVRKEFTILPVYIPHKRFTPYHSHSNNILLWLYKIHNIKMSTEIFTYLRTHSRSSHPKHSSQNSTRNEKKEADLQGAIQ